MSPSDPIITVRDWRRRPPLRLRLRVTKKLHIHWCWIKCSRCPHMRAVAIAPYIICWGPDGWQDMLRRAGATTPVVGRLRHRLGVDADQPDGAAAELCRTSALK
jgi:hypothetical protein